MAAVEVLTVPSLCGHIAMWIDFLPTLSMRALCVQKVMNLPVHER